MKERLCPCGCGKPLFAYNGKRALVCYAAWQRIPVEIRSRFYWGDDAGKRTAAMAIIRTALKIRAGLLVFLLFSCAAAHGAAANAAIRRTSPTAKSVTAGETATFTITTTAYCQCRICCGPGARGVTASGRRPVEGTTVAANWLPLGTQLHVQGFRVPKVVQDRMHPRFSNRLDVFFRSHKDAERFGKRQLRVTITP